MDSGYSLKAISLLLPKQEFLEKQHQVWQGALSNQRPISFPALLNLKKRCDPELFSFIMSLIMSGIDCTDCGGLCCKAPQGVRKELEYISLVSFEIKLLRERLPSLDNYLITRHRNGKEITSLTYPCPFLADNKCSIYNDRPIVCRSYPIHELNGNYSLDTGCPGASKMCDKLAGLSWEFFHLVDNLNKAKEEIIRITQNVNAQEVP